MKKLFALTTMLLVLILVAAGCGQDAPAAPPADQVAAPPADQAAQPPAADEAIEDVEFDGPFYLAPLANPMTITFGFGFGDPGGAVRPGITPDIGAHVPFIKENLNVEIYYLWALPTAQALERFDLALVTGDLPDIMTLSPVQYFELARHGQLRDLRPAFERYARPEIIQMFADLDNVPLEIATVDGQLFGIPHVLDPTQWLVQLWYRGDWADALGFSTPTTMDELETMLQAFVDNEMGGPGTRGIGLFNDPVSWAPDSRAVFHGYDAFPGGSAGNWIMRDGRLVNALVQPEMQNALNRLRRWYASGIINPEFATFALDQLQVDLTAGRIGAISGEWWLGHWGPVLSSIEYNPEVEWRVTTVVPAAGHVGHTVHGRVNISNFRTLSANAPEGAEEALIKLLNWFWELHFVVDPLATIEDWGAGGAFIWSWWPSLIWNAFEQQYNFDMVNEAIRINDPDILTSEFQINLFKSYRVIFHNEQFEDFWSDERAWGEWFTRVSPDGGWGTNVDIRRRGAYVVSEFTGPPTPTHLSRGSILHDMWLEFYASYIMGAIPEDQWYTFVADWHNLGGADWTEEINAQFDAMQ